MKDTKKFVCLGLLLIYSILFIWSGINPTDRSVWVVEALTALVPVIMFIVLYARGIVMSTPAYILCSVFPIMHIIGAHYTFSLVPFDWFNNLIDADRNMYDRVAHTSVGLYAFMIVELLMRYNAVRSKWVAYSYAIFSIMALAAAYELFEWWYAISSDPSAGIAVLGSQGDIWDAQKDILMDTIGACIGVGVYMIQKSLRLKK
jgi:putative membrane protein